MKRPCVGGSGCSMERAGFLIRKGQAWAVICFSLTTSRPKRALNPFTPRPICAILALLAHLFWIRHLCFPRICNCPQTAGTPSLFCSLPCLFVKAEQVTPSLMDGLPPVHGWTAPTPSPTCCCVSPPGYLQHVHVGSALLPSLSRSDSGGWGPCGPQEGDITDTLRK